MAKNFYAVRKGLQTGIFNSWPECQRAIKGVSGAEFRGFNTKEEANAYLSGVEVGVNGGVVVEVPKPNDSMAVIYTDGSYKGGSLNIGVVVDTVNGRFRFYGTIYDKRYEMSQNVTSELISSLVGIELAMDMGFKYISVCYDYTGVEGFATGWKPREDLPRRYQSLMQNFRTSKGVVFDFVKIAAHSGVEGNKLADSLAARSNSVNESVDLDKVLRGILTVSDVPRL